MRRALVALMSAAALLFSAVPAQADIINEAWYHIQDGQGDDLWSEPEAAWHERVKPSGEGTVEVKLHGWGYPGGCWLDARVSGVYNINSNNIMDKVQLDWLRLYEYDSSSGWELEKQLFGPLTKDTPFFSGWTTGDEDVAWASGTWSRPWYAELRYRVHWSDTGWSAYAKVQTKDTRLKVDCMFEG